MIWDSEEVNVWISARAKETEGTKRDSEISNESKHCGNGDRHTHSSTCMDKQRDHEKLGIFLILYTLFEPLNRNFFQLNQFVSHCSHGMSSYKQSCAINKKKNTLHLSSSLQAITLPTINHNVYIHRMILSHLVQYWKDITHQENASREKKKKNIPTPTTY